MECTIVSYSSVHNYILHFMLTNGLKYNNLLINEYCNGEVLKLNPSNKYTGSYKINIVYPTHNKDELKKLVGRSDIIYCNVLHHHEDRNIMYEHFGYMFKDEDYTKPQLFNMKTYTKDELILPEVTHVKNENYQLMKPVALKYVVATNRHASKEFILYHVQQKLEHEYLEII